MGTRARIGLGCMRLSTDADRDDERAMATIAAAVAEGITLFDTAHAYGLDERDLGHNERLLARTLPRTGDVRVVTKGGMARTGGRWIPDGRAKTIRADCEASLEALGGLDIDLWLLHAPDPRTPWRTSLRALARLRDEGLVKDVGVSNVNVAQLNEAIDIAGISAVQNAFSVFDDRAVRGGVVERSQAAGLLFLAHSPLGGPKRANRVAREEGLGRMARAHEASEAEIALAWLLTKDVVPIPGARRPDTARSVARAAQLELADDERDVLDEAFGASRRRRVSSISSAREVVVIMGIPGAGKTRLAAEYVSRGFVRLNRDETGGTLRDVARKLDEGLADRARSFVLDNTYLTRATRSHVLDAAHRHGATSRCVWLDTPLDQAQINMVERLLDLRGSLPDPDELKPLVREGILAPTSLMRTVRELEPPADDEGWANIECVEFVREPRSGGDAVFVAVQAVEDALDELQRTEPDAPHLVFAWDPDGARADLERATAYVADVVSGPVESALCAHPGGPPVCWCRPPLPGLALAFAREHAIDPARSTLIGNGPAHRTLATALGARYVGVKGPT